MSDERCFPPGAFCWIELATTDAAGAKAFYSDLLGFGANDVDMGEMGSYTLLQLDSADVAGLYTLSAEQSQQGIPPHWLSYVRVEDASASAEKAESLGGNIMMGPLDVPGVGRMAIVRDSGDAVLALFQPGEHKGAQPMDNKPGMFCWNELATRDPDVSIPFYEGLFGWKADRSDPVYTMWMNGDRLAGGMLTISAEMGDVPPNWMVYFAVADCDAAAEKASGNGAHVVVPPSDIDDIGRFSVLVDPQGAAFAIITLATPETND